MGIIEGSDNIITVEFGKGNSNKPTKGSVDKKVEELLTTPSILHQGQMFIDKNRLRSMSDSVRNFFEVLQKESYIEIHVGVNNLDQSSYLICGDIKGNTYTISMNDFISVLSHYQELSRLNGIELEDILENFFEEQGKEIHIEYFSPREFFNKIDTMRLPLMDHGYDPIFVKDDYFYSIQTQGKDDVDILRVSPEAILDSNFRDHDLLLMIAHYLEQVYSDSLRDYNDETQVEIIKYDYDNHTTYIETLILADLTGFCITEIRDRNPLIQGNDIKKMITNYLNRTIIEEQNADIIPLEQ